MNTTQKHIMDSTERFARRVAVVFYISATVAFLPVIVFTMWGDDKRQWWAGNTPSTTTENSFYKSQLDSQSTTSSSKSAHP
uniref:Uncharacterized protein n=1 Tax=Ditylenchus dipsaci TaxID=166011 RepID=A0A915EQP6_9BILA